MIPKFRAWDKDEKVMRIVNEIHFTIKTITCEPLKGHDNMLEMYNPICFEGHFELMQSTGLKDKNGVEIYEGDLIQNGRGEIGYVTYLLQETGFVVVLKNTDYRLGHRNTGESYDMAYWHEIIGNIYENTELLEER